MKPEEIYAAMDELHWLQRTKCNGRCTATMRGEIYGYHDPYVDSECPLHGLGMYGTPRRESRSHIDAEGNVTGP